MSTNLAMESMYRVVVNKEEQYSIWSSHLNIPKGWKSVGDEGPRAECLDKIETIWNDMRPLSLREKLAALE